MNNIAWYIGIFHKKLIWGAFFAFFLPNLPPPKFGSRGTCPLHPFSYAPLRGVEGQAEILFFPFSLFFRAKVNTFFKEKLDSLKNVFLT